jgi:hypothetical protein
MSLENVEIVREVMDAWNRRRLVAEASGTIVATLREPRPLGSELSDRCSVRLRRGSPGAPALAYSGRSAAAFRVSSEVSQRFLMSRDAIGAASLPRPLNSTSSSTRRWVPPLELSRL